MKTLIAACLVIFLANIAFAQNCPSAGSHAEFDLLLTQGPSFVHGVPAGECLRLVIAREKEFAPPTMTEKELMMVLMDGAWKAESSRVPVTQPDDQRVK